MKTISFVTILLLFSIMLVAQSDFKDGYIITLDEDTVYGLIDYRGDEYNAANCVFRAGGGETKTAYYPGRIKAYRFTDGKFYVSREVVMDSVKRLVFLEHLVKGKASIYYYPKKNYFLEVDSGELIRLENSLILKNIDGKNYFMEGNEYIGLLRYYLKDCPEIIPEINRTELVQPDLIKLAEKYHNYVCPGEVCTIYSKSKPRLKSRLGIGTGCDINRADIYTLDGAGNTISNFLITTPGPLFSLNLDAFSTGTFERWFSSLSLGYSQIVHSYENDTRIRLESHNIFVSFTINYIYPRYRIKPYAGMGGMYFITLADSNSYINNSYLSSSKRTMGPVFCLGAVFDLNERISFKFQTDGLYGLWNANDDIFTYIGTDNMNLTLSVQCALTK
jgi:hypothetical protein